MTRRPPKTHRHHREVLSSGRLHRRSSPRIHVTRATDSTQQGRKARPTSRRAHASKPYGQQASPNWIFGAYLVLLAFEWLGLQNEIAPLRAIRFTTLLGYGLFVALIFQRNLSDIWRTQQARIFFTLIALTTLSMMWAVVTKHAFDSIRPLVDYAIFFFLTAALVDRRSRITTLAWTLLAICTILVIRNFSKLGQTLRVGGFKAGYFLGDGNDFAWGMIIALPLIASLLVIQKDFLNRTAGLVGASVCLLGIVGTGSRGGSLALGASLIFYLVFLSKKKLAGLSVIAAVLLGVFLIAPGSYFDRMKTVATYEEDSSAQSRLMLWGYAFDMAVDFPLGVGAGNFASAYGRYYAPVGERSADANAVAWGQGRWLNAHSIYFKALGEYGFLGFFLVIWLILRNLQISLHARNSLLLLPRSEIPSEWAGLVAMSICGFAVAGIFLGGLAYPHMFFLSGLVVAISNELARKTSEAPSITRQSTSKPSMTPSLTSPHGTRPNRVEQKHPGRGRNTSRRS